MKKAIIDERACVACGCCEKVCPRGAIRLRGGVCAVVEDAKCVGCGLCKKACPASIIQMEVRT